MPYPSQLDHSQLVQTAQMLIERDGVETFSLGAVARELNVKTPSLYRYVESKLDLLRQVNLAFLGGLVAAMQPADTATGSPQDHMLAAMHAYRRYAHDHPRLYLMSFAYRVDALRPDEDLLVGLVLPLQSIMAAISGEAQSLTALRGAFALLHGFVMLELTDQLRRGGDLDAAFDESAQAYLAGWARQR